MKGLLATKSRQFIHARVCILRTCVQIKYKLRFRFIVVVFNVFTSIFLPTVAIRPLKKYVTTIIVLTKLKKLMFYKLV